MSVKKVNYFDFECAGIKYKLEVPLDDWDDIKFDKWFYTKDLELNKILAEYVKGNDMYVTGTDYKGITHEKVLVKKSFTDSEEFAFVPFLVSYILLDYIEKTIGFGSVIKLPEVDFYYVPEYTPAKREDVYYLGVYCRKVNTNPYYDSTPVDKGCNYYIEKKGV